MSCSCLHDRVIPLYQTLPLDLSDCSFRVLFPKYFLISIIALIYKQTTNNDCCSEIIDIDVQPDRTLHVLMKYDEDQW